MREPYEPSVYRLPIKQDAAAIEAEIHIARLRTMLALPQLTSVHRAALRYAIMELERTKPWLPK